MADFIGVQVAECPETSDLIESLPPYVVIPDRKTFDTKISAMRKDGGEELGIITDFDRTCNNSKGGYSTSFNVLKLTDSQSHLREIGDMVYDHFRCREQDGTLTAEDLDCWWQATITMFDWFRVDRKAVQEAALVRDPDNLDELFLIPRNGLHELVLCSARQDVPFLVFSAGLGDIIEGFFKLHGIEIPPEMVIGNRLRFDAQGKIDISNASPPITSAGKVGDVIKKLCPQNAILGRKNILLLGDSLDDPNMTEGLDCRNVLRVGYYLRGNSDTETFERFCSKYDVVICGDQDMSAVIALFDYITRDRSS